jgi:hypothetical protein
MVGGNWGQTGESLYAEQGMILNSEVFVKVRKAQFWLTGF